MAKVIATQNGIIVGTVEKVTLKEGGNKDKTKKSMDFTWNLKEKTSGVLVFVKKRFWLDENEEIGETSKEIFESLKADMQIMLENKGTFGSVKWYTGKEKDKKTPKQYNWITINDEGFINVDGNVEILMDTGYEKLETKITATMYIEDKDGNNIRLTDGASEFEKTLPIVVPERYNDLVDKFLVGYGYEFGLQLVKGAKETIKEGQFDIDDDTTSSGGFEPNYLEVIGAKKIKDMVLEEFNKSESTDLI